MPSKSKIDESPWAGRSFEVLTNDKNIIDLLADMQQMVLARNLPPRETIAVLTMALCGTMRDLSRHPCHDHRAEIQDWVNEITKWYPMKWVPEEEATTDA